MVIYVIYNMGRRSLDRVNITCFKADSVVTRRVWRSEKTLPLANDAKTRNRTLKQMFSKCTDQYPHSFNACASFVFVEAVPLLVVLLQLHKVPKLKSSLDVIKKPNGSRVIWD